MRMESCDAPDLLALDFDGVICDGLEEFFQLAWQTCCELWTPPQRCAPEVYREPFYRTRPLIGATWEMPLLIRALQKGRSEQELHAAWLEIAHELLAQEGPEPQVIGETLDRLRTEWITADVASWLRLHQFPRGVVPQLKRLLADQRRTQVVVITAKYGPFAHLLLTSAGVTLPAERVIGKESGESKQVSLRRLLDSQERTVRSIWFVEDRLKTLEQVFQTPGLESVELFLAEWGYVTRADLERARGSERVHLLDLERFAGPFHDWRGGSQAVKRGAADE